MQVPDEVRKCVVFLAYRKDSGDIRPGGTAFFVQVPTVVSQGLACDYLVTARHVIEEIRKRSIDGNLLIRANGRDGKATLWTSSLADWEFHEDERVDVAVSWVGGLEKVHLRYLTLDSFATATVITEEEIGIGDDVFVTGLFTRHMGKAKNIPILRSGIISAMPDELVPTKTGLQHGYLVECRSIGGLSGSPVFVHLGVLRQRAGNIEMTSRGFRLLGVMHGHWEFRDDDDIVISDGVFNEEKLNTGIAFVIPADAILEVLNKPALRESREHAAAILLAHVEAHDTGVHGGG